mgnify:CR=1 FL=1
MYFFRIIFVEKIEPPLTPIPASTLSLSSSLTSSLSDIMIYEDQDNENIPSNDCKYPDTPTVKKEQRSVLGEFQVFEDDAELKFITPGKNIVYKKL